MIGMETSKTISIKNQRAINPLYDFIETKMNIWLNKLFKIRVKEITITESKKYKEVFVTHQYLIRSKDFKKKLLYSCSKKIIFSILVE